MKDVLTGAKYLLQSLKLMFLKADNYVLRSKNRTLLGENLRLEIEREEMRMRLKEYEVSSMASGPKNPVEGVDLGRTDERLTLVKTEAERGGLTC